MIDIDFKPNFCNPSPEVVTPYDKEVKYSRTGHKATDNQL